MVQSPGISYYLPSVCKRWIASRISNKLPPPWTWCLHDWNKTAVSVTLLVNSHRGICYLSITIFSGILVPPPGLICLTAVSSTGLYCQVDYHVQHISLFLEYLLRLTFLWWIYFFILFWPYPFRPDHYPLWPTTPLVVLLLLYLISALPFLFANYFSFPVDSPSVSTYFLFRIK